ncbi:MAG: Hpt domain-containing protein [Phycisphaerae bacterium]
MSSSIEITPELMAGFLDEAPEYLEMLDSGLMDLESMAGDGVIALNTPEDCERMNEMFRAAHSLKGLAAAFGFEKIKDLTHHMETLFDHVRLGKKSLYDHSIETLFTVFDRLKALISELSDPEGPEVEIADMVDELKRILAEGANPPATNNSPACQDSQEPVTTPVADTPSTSDAVVSGSAGDLPVGATADEVVDDSPCEVQSEVFQDPELASLFIETVSESLEELNQGLLGLENAPDDNELLNQIFRSAHNIKGASGAAGLSGMNRVTHNMETVFDKLRNGRTSLEDSLMGALFEAVDRLRGVIDMIREGQVEDIGDHEMKAQFDPWIGKETASSHVPNLPEIQVPDEHQPPDFVIEEAGDDDGSGRYKVVVRFKDGFDEAPIQAYLIYNKLVSMGDVLSCEPDIDSLTGDTDLSQLEFHLCSEEPSVAIESAVSLFEVQEVVVSPLGAASEDVAEAATGCGNVPEATTVNETNTDTNSLTAPSTTVASSSSAEAPISVGAESNHDARVVSENATTDAAGSSSAMTAVSATNSPAAVQASGGTNANLGGGSGSSTAVAPSNVPEARSSGGVRQAPPAPTPPDQGQRGGGRAVGERKTEQSAVKTGETLRVDLERLDQLMNLGGELVINKARFGQIHGTFREIFDGKNHAYLVDDISQRLEYLRERMEGVSQSGCSSADAEIFRDNLLHLNDSMGTIRSLVERVYDARLAMHDFDEALHGLGRVSEGLQKGIMGTRMVPIGPLFKRFQRVVRDISKSCGKRVNLVLHGEQTELDKRMIDELGDPLTHMVRNAVDHGLEKPDVRASVGKPETGTLTLEACHRGNSICIEVSDDGGGVNVERVRAKVLEKELATEAQVERMSDRELIQYILKPGFSTAAQVTDLSGRGMGMDIVVAKLDQLNGSIEIDSTPGEGTKITIRLPLTLAILTSMVAQIGKATYAIPLESVLEIIRVRKSDIQRIQRREVVRVRDRVVPLTCFEDVFGTTHDALQTASKGQDELTLVIVGFENDQLGLMVDELLGQEDVVIKSIAENYKNVDGIAGASIRGDGTVALILDVGAMMTMAGEAGARQPLEQEVVA